MAAQAPVAPRWRDPYMQSLQDRLSALLARQQLPYRAVLVEVAPGMPAIQIWDGSFKIATQAAEPWLLDMGA